MSQPNGNDRPRRRIVGPQSALTDFLASHNISSRQIELDFQARREALARQAVQEQEQNGAEEASAPITATATATAATPVASTNSTPSKKQKDQKKAIDKIKQGKKNKKRKFTDSDDEDDAITQALMQNFGTPMPGQMENCAKCGKRFTVTPYSRADATGKLLCSPCGRALDKEDDDAFGTGKRGATNKKKNARATGGATGQRRKKQSQILDRAATVGPKPLATLCVEHLSKNIHLAEDLGDLPDKAVDKIARILSKRRLLTPKTMDLFVRPDAEQIRIYDAGELWSGDFLRMLQTMPQLRRIALYNAIQFKDEVMDYMINRDIDLESFCVTGANLISDSRWKSFLVQKGGSLETLQICDTDKYVTDEVMTYVADCAPQLKRLKINGNQCMTGKGVAQIARLAHLEHLGLQLTNTPSSDVLVSLLSKIGPQLQTLSLRRATAADNAVLHALRSHARSLRKLRITESDRFTDGGFVYLFSNGWENPPLEYVDLGKNRHDDAERPRNNPDNVGLCGPGFEALMEHSGSALQYLNVESCRHITAAAFEAVFAADKTYPQLRHIEVSFCEEVTDHIVSCMFRCCPNLREVVTFGCMLLKGTEVPHGRVVIGVPNAVGMQTVGYEEA